MRQLCTQWIRTPVCSLCRTRLSRVGTSGEKNENKTGLWNVVVVAYIFRHSSLIRHQWDDGDKSGGLLKIEVVWIHLTWWRGGTCPLLLQEVHREERSMTQYQSSAHLKHGILSYFCINISVLKMTCHLSIYSFAINVRNCYLQPPVWTACHPFLSPWLVPPWHQLQVDFWNL